MKLEKVRSEFEAKNAQIVALAVQNQGGAAKTNQGVGAGYPVLADADHNIADAYGVYNLLDDGIAAPSVFIINQKGEIVWSYIGKNASDRPSNQTILENIP